MDIGAIIIIIVIGGILVLTFYIIGLYNNLLNAKNKVEDKFTKINTEISKEIKLIPDIIELLNKHTKHEEKIINELTKMKDTSNKLNTINDKIKFLNNHHKLLDKIYKLTETYPKLKTSRNFNSLNKEITEIKDKIEYATEFYNIAVTNYNNLKEQYPTNILAKILKFEEINMFK